LGGGISSKLAGGTFVDGARNGIITAGLNHAMHAVVEPIVSVLYSYGTLSATTTHSSYSNGAAGHIALRINEDVYSFEGDGYWRVRKFEAYKSYEVIHRNLAEIFIVADGEAILGATHYIENGTYDLRTNTCVTNTMDLLASGGIGYNSPNGVITPSDFVSQLLQTTHFRGISHFTSIHGDIQLSFSNALKSVALPFSGFKLNTNKLY
jgi:hypothetical protein